ncbi:MAG: DMT family transporter [candidate division Zixibacteria bacterium]|nr:DMT family transporter [candidate division Zixibacteria bacterium]
MAALTTAFLWSFTSIFFTLAGRRIGSYWVNKFRMPLASVFLAITLFITTGQLLPNDVSSYAFIYLTLSGIIGLALGDTCLFRAFVILGTRLTLLVFTVSPIIAALTAWILLGEKLGLMAILGIGITVGGVAWVTAERSQKEEKNNYADQGSKITGILLAVGGAAGQAIGLVLAKSGMSDGIDPLPATFIRMITATAAIWLFSLFKGDIKKTITKLKDSRALWWALGGTICGPFLGVWLSLVAVNNTEAGIAAAIMATAPVLVIPLVIIVYKEKVSIRAFIGAIIAAGGVALLFLG